MISTNDNSHSAINEPMLDTRGMINHLKSRGVKFIAISEDGAYSFLEINNNYFKLHTYSENFPVFSNGENSGKFIDLDFAALIKLSTIDMRLRYIFIQMCLDIEHYLKVYTIKFVQDNNKEDAYSIVTDFAAEMDRQYARSENRQGYLEQIEEESEKDEYRKDLVNRYRGNWPIWAFCEVIHFSDLIKLYVFARCRYACSGCMDREKVRTKTCDRITSGEINACDAYYCANHQDSDIRLCSRLRKIEQADRLLQEVRRLRNASAHNSCVLNNLRPPKGHSSDDNPPPLVDEYFINSMPGLQKVIPGLKLKNVHKALTNPRIRQIFSVLCAHRYFVTSDKVKKHRWKDLRDYCDTQLTKEASLFQGCEPVVKFFNLLKSAVDIWAEP